MLAIAKRITLQGYAFASSRAGVKKEQKVKSEAETKEKDVFKAYREQVEKGSILRQFREDVFRRSELAGDWNQTNKMEKQSRELEKMLKVDKE